MPMNLIILLMQVMHGEDYICLGFLFGEKSKVAYISDVSRFPSNTEYGRCCFCSFSCWRTCIYTFYTFSPCDVKCGGDNSIFYMLLLVACQC